MYNEISRNPEEGWKIRPAYQQAAIGHGKASECIQCRSCASHCPQKINIPEEMKKAAQALER